MISYNPYGWTIRPRATKKERIEKKIMEQIQLVEMYQRDLNARLSDYLCYGRGSILDISRAMKKLDEELEQLEILRIRYKS